MIVLLVLLLLLSAGVFSAPSITDGIDSPKVEEPYYSNYFPAPTKQQTDTDLVSWIPKTNPIKKMFESYGSTGSPNVHFHHEVQVLLMKLHPIHKIRLEEKCIGAVINKNELIIPETVEAISENPCIGPVAEPIRIRIISGHRGLRNELITQITHCTPLAEKLILIRIEKEIQIIAHEVASISAWSADEKPSGTALVIGICSFDRPLIKEFECTIEDATSNQITAKNHEQPIIFTGSTIIKKRNTFSKYELIGMHVGKEGNVTDFAPITQSMIDEKRLFVTFSSDNKV